MTPVALLLLFSPPQDDFAKTWSTVERAIRNRFYARETRKADMNALLLKYGKIAPRAHDRAEFSTTVNEMIAEFKDSHFGFFTRADQGFYSMDGLTHPQNPAPMPHIGAWFKPAVGGYTVSMVLNGGEAEKQGLRKGDLVMSINDLPFEPIQSLVAFVDKDATIAVRRGSETLTKQVHVTKQPTLEAFLEASKESRRTIEINGRKIGYFHLWTQAQEAFKAALAGAIYGPLSGTDAMILDLRDGFGGRPEGYADPFFRPEVVITTDFGASGSSAQIFGYQRPLIVIINGGSRSAKEVLSYVLKTSKRAKLVGSRTAGNVLGTSPQAISDWAYIEIPLVNMFVDGIRLENNGVTPDIEVPREFDDAGKDLYLEAALRELRNVRKYAGPLASKG